MKLNTTEIILTIITGGTYLILKIFWKPILIIIAIAIIISITQIAI